MKYPIDVEEKILAIEAATGEKIDPKLRSFYEAYVPVFNRAYADGLSLKAYTNDLIGDWEFYFHEKPDEKIVVLLNWVTSQIDEAYEAGKRKALA